MNPIEAYLAEFEQEAATTRRVLAAAPVSKYDWRPHEKGMSMGELCSHIAHAPAGMTQVLAGDSLDVSQIPPPDEAPASKDVLLAAHDEATRACLAWMSNLGEKAGEMWRLTNGDEELMAMPRVIAIRFFLLNHLYHHRGQLTTYLRSVGEVVPSVYGPTADENPFE